jgi:hypothetical protein
MAVPLILLLLQDVLSAPDNPQATTEQRHIFLCVKAIMTQYFTQERPTVFIIPGSSLNVNKRERILGNDREVRMRHGTLDDGNEEIVHHGNLGSGRDGHIRQETLVKDDDVQTRRRPLGSGHNKSTTQGTNLPNTHHYHSHDHLTGFMIQALSQEETWQFIMMSPRKNGTKMTMSLEQQEQYIIILWPMNEQVLSYLNKIILANTPSSTKGKIIAVLTDDFLLQDEELRLEILREVTDRPTHNAIIVVPASEHVYTNMDHRSDTSNVVDLYTWFRREADKYCDEFKDLLPINSWLIEEDGRFLKYLNLFRDQTLAYSRGCTVAVYNTIHQLFATDSSPVKHLENHVLKAIMDSLNITITFVKSQKDSQIFIGGIGLNMVRIPKDGLFYASYPYLFIAPKWYVKCGNPIPRQGNFTKVFAWSVWLALSLVCLLAVLATFWIQRISQEPRGASECFLAVWAVTLGVSVHQMPHTCRLRLFFFMWVCYSLAISTVFQGFFTSFLVEPGRQKQTSSLEKMIQSGEKCASTANYIMQWCADKTEVCSACSQHCNDTFTCLGNLLEPENYAVLASELDMEVMLPYFSRKHFHCSTEDEVIHIMYLMLVKKRSFAINIIDTKIRNMMEAGIIEKLKSESVKQIRKEIGTEIHSFLTNQQSENLKTSLKNNAASDENNESDYFVFTISHLQVAFYLLIIGHGVSCAMLVIEILIYNIQYHFNLRRQRM